MNATGVKVKESPQSTAVVTPAPYRTGKIVFATQGHVVIPSTN